jgi:hypothetical protein
VGTFGVQGLWPTAVASRSALWLLLLAAKTCLDHQGMHPVSDGEAYPEYTEGQRHAGGLHFLCVAAQGQGGI